MKYLIYAIITILIITGIIWGFSAFILGTLSTEISQGIILFGIVLTSVVVLLSKLPTIVDLIRTLIDKDKKKEETSSKIISNGPIINNYYYGDVNITETKIINYVSQDVDITYNEPPEYPVSNYLPGPQHYTPNPNYDFSKANSRDELIHGFKEILFHKGEIVSIVGVAGIGKTVFAKTIIKDKEVINKYRDGILWTNGNDGINPLMDWKNLISPEQSEHNKNEDIKAEFIHSIKNKQLLFVIDDADDDNLEFIQFLHKNMSHKSRIIFTSRKINLYDTSSIFTLDLLTQAEAVKLLESSSGLTFEENQFDLVHSLIFFLGNLPLAIILAGRLLKNGYQLPDLYDKVSHSKEGSLKLNIDMIRNDKNTLNKIIMLVLESLGHEKLVRFFMLGKIYSEDRGIYLADVITLWDTTFDDAKYTLIRFQKAGLIALENGKIEFHPIIINYILDNINNYLV